MKSNLDHFISIEVISGGFVLTYPVSENEMTEYDSLGTKREVFVSERKLLQKIKDVLALLNASNGSSEPDAG